VVGAHQLGRGVAHQLEEHAVGVHDVALEIELDDRLGLVDRFQDAAEVRFVHDVCSFHVGGCWGCGWGSGLSPAVVLISGRRTLR
jgi:predicted GNAT family acetyltransferase